MNTKNSNHVHKFAPRRKNGSVEFCACGAWRHSPQSLKINPPIVCEPAKHITLLSEIRPIIESLNAQFGKGSVRQINLTLSGQGVFEQVPFQCRSQWRKFTILDLPDKLTVFALGHQKTNWR